MAVAEVRVDEVDDDISSSDVAIEAEAEDMPMPLVTLDEPVTFRRDTGYRVLRNCRVTSKMIRYIVQEVASFFSALKSSLGFELLRARDNSENDKGSFC